MQAHRLEIFKSELSFAILFTRKSPATQDFQSMYMLSCCNNYSTLLIPFSLVESSHEVIEGLNHDIF